MSPKRTQKAPSLMGVKAGSEEVVSRKTRTEAKVRSSFVATTSEPKTIHQRCRSPKVASLSSLPALRIASTASEGDLNLFWLPYGFLFFYRIREPSKSERSYDTSRTEANIHRRILAIGSAMTSVLPCHPRNWLGIQENSFKNRFVKVQTFGYSALYFSPGVSTFAQGQYLVSGYHGRTFHSRPVFSSTMDDNVDPSDSEDSNSEEEIPQRETGGVNNEFFREDLERIVGADDSTFSGIDLATLIRNKYGRSYDVLLIKKEFMGRNLLAMNVMWKYMEQRSFPLTEEEYLLRLDDVANTLKCWGAVSHIRNSLAKLKERPRIGKAVSIFIDMDESGGRANEWIYK
ncbi:hypothetical protein NE237_020436 [Protea cynaroides]|uniref:Uncharacterized protein n=1 Tax=Protea cynaroides TaxID=273540 RepID=A0A9Q0K2B0_9MAGN|nr:hypothetical protein NE237_020436 [Protea cynaroides]